jgi:hypothetical protein
MTAPENIPQPDAPLAYTPWVEETADLAAQVVEPDPLRGIILRRLGVGPGEGPGEGSPPLQRDEPSARAILEDVCETLEERDAGDGVKRFRLAVADLAAACLRDDAVDTRLFGELAWLAAACRVAAEPEAAGRLSDAIWSFFSGKVAADLADLPLTPPGPTADLAQLAFDLWLALTDPTPAGQEYPYPCRLQAVLTAAQRLEAAPKRVDPDAAAIWQNLLFRAAVKADPASAAEVCLPALQAAYRRAGDEGQVAVERMLIDYDELLSDDAERGHLFASCIDADKCSEILALWRDLVGDDAPWMRDIPPITGKIIPFPGVNTILSRRQLEEFRGDYGAEGCGR